MNILSQSVSPTVQPVVLSSKGSATEEVCEHVQVSLPLQGANSTNTSQLKNVSVSVAKGGSFKQVQPLSGASDIVASTERQIGIMKETDWIFNFSHLFRNEFHSGYIDGNDANKVLVVSVYSAVKLDSRQMDLITRKMQRLTGFRKLRLENSIYPSLIAGFVISYCNDGSQVIDLSVRGQLALLAASLESSDQMQSAAGYAQT